MIIFYLIEFALVVIFLMFMISQVIIPAYERRKIFPMFTKISEMEAAEVEINQKAFEIEKQKSLNKIMKEVK